MQANVNYVTINEFPKFLYSNLTNETHSIIVTNSDEPAQGMILTLDIRGVTTYFPTGSITKDEWGYGLHPN